MLFQFKDLAYTLGNAHARRIVVSSSVESGGVLVVSGISGAGKSTLLRILARLQPALAGEVSLGSKSWQEYAAPVWRSRVHYVAQQAVLFEGTVAENFALPFSTRVCGEKIFDTVRAKGLLEELRLPGKLWDQDARTLSGGEKARVAFARSLLIDPNVLLLDEPTAALDELAREAFYRVLGQWLKVPEHGVLLISHNHDYQELQRVSVLEIVPVEGEV